MVEVSKDVWTRWAKLLAEDNKPFISLLLVSGLPRARVQALVDEAAAEAATSLEHAWELARETDPFADLGVGAVSTAMMPDGVVIMIGGGAEQFAQQLGLIVGGLDHRGVDGKLRVFKPPRAKQPPSVMPLVECRLRVLGERHHDAGPHYHWRVEPDAWAAVIRAGIQWGLAAPGQATVQVGLMPRTVVWPAVDPAQLVLDAAEANYLWIIEFASGERDRWRMVAVEPFKRRISLIEASEAIQSHGWQQTVSGMTAFLRDNSELLLYALIKHGTSVHQARQGYSLVDDWPPRPGFDASLRWEYEFEDSYAPDAFAVQLLGPGYAGRIPKGPNWRQTEHGHDRVLLEHVNPENWFQARFVQLGGRSHFNRPAPEPPDVLTEARTDLAGILFTDQLIDQHV